jgi:hypothetical protein
MRGLELVPPSNEEVRELSDILNKQVSESRVRVVLSGGKRFPIVGVGFKFYENEGDIFASPFDLYEGKE